MTIPETSGARTKTPELPWESLQRQLDELYRAAQSWAYAACQETRIKISGESYSVSIGKGKRVVEGQEVGVKEAFLERLNDKVEEPSKYPIRIVVVATNERNPKVLSTFFSWSYGEREDRIVGWGIGAGINKVIQVHQIVQANHLVDLGDEDREGNRQSFSVKFQYDGDALTSLHLDVGYSLQTLRASFDFWPEQPPELREPREFRGRILLKPTFDQMRQALANILKGKPAIMMETTTAEQVSGI